MTDITINGISVDPLAPVPLSQPKLSPMDAANSNYILVQTKEPLNAKQKSDLKNIGAEILEYVKDAYICQYAPVDLTPILSLPFVIWAGPYLPGFKIPASMSPLRRNQLSLAEAAALPTRVFNDSMKTVNVVFHRDAKGTDVIKKVAEAAGLDPADLKVFGNKVQITLPIRQVSELAALDEVKLIEEVFPSKLHNDVAREILGVNAINSSNPKFEGAGQVVAVADTGFDKGSTMDVHPAFTGRVRKLYALGRSKSNDPHGHGTHVAGSVLGDGSSAALGNIRGTAPKAELVFQSVLDVSGGLGGLPSDLHDLFETPYTEDGARVHTNSWGSTLGDGRYDSQAFEVDDFVWNNRDCVILFAAGNEGQDADQDGIVDPMSVTPPGTAKNCITIGASENDRPTISTTYGTSWPNKFPSNPVKSDRVADNINGLVAFSSRGPTKDARFKPDLVAPGTFILSSRSRDTTTTGWRLSADPLYMFDGGTSMATPLVAGCAALVREYLIKERNIIQPSAALIKAMLINGAIDLAGQYIPSECGSIPNYAEGFGRVDMTAMIDPNATQVELWDEGVQLDTGEEHMVAVNVPVGVTALKATLVWTDPPGETLQNDLDLIVRSNTPNGIEERHGNVLIGPSISFDRVNNVEQVYWFGIPTGSVDIVVHAFRITKFPQSFALVVRSI